MAKSKRGLHKEISSIFGGAPVPGKDDAKQQPCPPPPQGPVREQRTRINETPWGQPSTQEPPVQAPKIPKPLEPHQAVQPPRVIPAKPPKRSAIEKQHGAKISWGQIQKKLFAAKPGAHTGRQKKMVILVPILFIVFIFVFSKVLFGPKGKSPVDVNQTQTSAAVVFTGQINWQIPDPYPTTLRDPMRSGPVIGPNNGTTTTVVDPLVTDQIDIKGILWVADNPSVNIGSEIFHEGDQVAGATIVKIHQESVEFEKDGKRWTQKVPR
ncbi:MAG: hypothetical protein ACYTBJ_08085 [Planctomycetota bacterium]|jgi:hypothetical protein